jgi:multidrug efflux system membrane fusion protein
MSTRTRAALIRIGIAVIVVGAVVWVVKSRSSSAPAAATAPTGGSSERTTTSSGSGDRVVPVQVATVLRKDLPIWLEGLGSVTAFQQVTVRSQVDGRLDKVLFTEGQAVKKGDVLAQIDPRPFMVMLHTAQGAYARDKAQYDAAKRNYERYKGLQEQKLVAQQQVDEFASQVGQYEGAVKIDQAQVESAQLQLDYAQVKSPLDGITGVRLVDAGNLIKAADPTGLVVITAIEPVAVMFTVPQDRLPGVAAALARGDIPVEVWNRDGTQKLATGKLAVLDNQINQATSTLRLKAVVPNPGRVLWPNAFVKARMLVETRTGALVVPAVALQRGPQGTYVYVVGADKTAAMKPVTVGLLTGDQAIIDKGLDGGEQVVIEGQNQIRPGGRVEPSKPSAAGPSGSKKQPASP